MTIPFLIIMVLAVYISLGGDFFSNLFSTMTEPRGETLDRMRIEYGDGLQPFSVAEAQRFAQVDVEEHEKDWDNYHQNIHDSMFWGGANTEQLKDYEEDYL